MARWKLSPSKRFEISHFQHVNCRSKNPISPKVFNRFSKTLLHLKRVESGHLGWNVQVPRHFTFAMARWKLSPAKRFEIFHFQPVNRTSKYPISPKVFNRFSKTLLHLKRVESGHLARKVHVRRNFAFAMARWKLSPSKRFEISHFQPVNCPSKNPISPKVFNRFSKTLLHLQRFESGNLSQKFQVPRYFNFAMARWILSPSTRFEIFHFQPVNCPGKNPISPKVFTRFSKTLLHLKSLEGGDSGRKFQVPRYFTFAMARWKLSPSTRFEIFQFQPVKTLLHLKRVESGNLGWNVQMPRYFTFAMAAWKLSPSTRFEIFHFQPVNRTSKYAISPKVFNRFSKSLLHLQRFESGHLGRKFQVPGYFTFAMARWKLSPSTRFEIFHFQPVNCPGKNPISPKVFTRFSKTLLHLKSLESGHLGWKFHVRRYFTFAVSTWKLSPSTRFEISHF